MRVRKGETQQAFRGEIQQEEVAPLLLPLSFTFFSSLGRPIGTWWHGLSRTMSSSSSSNIGARRKRRAEKGEQVRKSKRKDSSLSLAPVCRGAR